MSLRIDTFVLGLFKTNCYVLRDGAECWVVDPGLLPRRLIRFLRAENIVPSRILLTHGHGDHIAGVNQVLQAFAGAAVCCPAGDAAMLGDPDANLSRPFGVTLTVDEPDELVQPGHQLALGRSAWRVLDTSGHTPGGVSYYCRSAEVVLTGDSLFAGTIGRTDIPGASAGRLLRNIQDQLLVLPDDTRVLPGHGPKTTIGIEKETNPFFADGKLRSEFSRRRPCEG